MDKTKPPILPLGEAVLNERLSSNHFIKKVLPKKYCWLKDTTGREKAGIQERIDRTDRGLDALVYELYGLNEEEIRVVGGVVWHQRGKGENEAHQ